MDRVLFRITEAAEMLGLSRATVYELVQRREIRTLRVGTARRIPAEAIGEFVRRKEEEAETAAS